MSSWGAALRTLAGSIWLACAASGCAGNTTQLFHTRLLHVDRAEGAATHFDVPLRTGQIVLSEAPGPHSLLFGLAPATFRRFTHSAIVIIDERSGDPFVYDMSAEFKPTLGTTPPESLRGGMRKTPFLDYVGMHLYVEVIEPSGPLDKASMAARVRALYEQKIDFDPYWDFADGSKLFCTEFVADVLRAGGGTIPALEPLNPNPSLRKVLFWFGGQHETSLPAGAFADSGRTVAIFSTWPSRAAAAGYFAAKRELHRRFTPDQKIGNLMLIEGRDVRLRPEIEAFLEQATSLYPKAKPDDVPPAEELMCRVDELAIERLGRADGRATTPATAGVVKRSARAVALPHHD